VDAATLMLSQQGDSKACIIYLFFFFFCVDLRFLLATTRLQSLVCGSYLSILSLSYLCQTGTK